MDNQLRDEALLEVEQLVKYRPDDASLQRLAVGLRELKPERPKATPPAANKIVAVELPDYNPESFPLFVAKVQPILMNACIRCHGPHDGNGFALLPTGDGSNRKAALANLAASLKAVKRSDLANSPLLLQAVQVHGKSVTPPLRDPQGQAFQYLETWVRMAVPEEPARLPEAVVAAPMAPAVVPMEKPIAKTSFGETSTTQPKPEPQREPKDPFDPAIFNGTIRKVGE